MKQISSYIIEKLKINSDCKDIDTHFELPLDDSSRRNLKKDDINDILNHVKKLSKENFPTKVYDNKYEPNVIYLGYANQTEGIPDDDNYWISIFKRADNGYAIKVEALYGKTFHKFYEYPKTDMIKGYSDLNNPKLKTVDDVFNHLNNIVFKKINNEKNK